MEACQQKLYFLKAFQVLLTAFAVRTIRVSGQHFLFASARAHPRHYDIQHQMKLISGIEQEILHQVSFHSSHLYGVSAHDKAPEQLPALEAYHSELHGHKPLLIASGNPSSYKPFSFPCHSKMDEPVNSAAINDNNAEKSRTLEHIINWSIWLQFMYKI